MHLSSDTLSKLLIAAVGGLGTFLAWASGHWDRRANNRRKDREQKLAEDVHVQHTIEFLSNGQQEAVDKAFRALTASVEQLSKRVDSQQSQIEGLETKLEAARVERDGLIRDIGEKERERVREKARADGYAADITALERKLVLKSEEIDLLEVQISTLQRAYDMALGARNTSQTTEIIVRTDTTRPEISDTDIDPD